MTAARRDPRPLRHALYTNAAGAGPDPDHRPPGGYRLVPVAEGWPRAGADRLERWLVAFAGGGPGATSSAVDGSGMATGALRLGGVVHAALARIDRGFGSDRLGRDGVLIHALLAPLDEDRPLDDDVFASLLAASRQVARAAAIDTGAGRLDAYLDACRGCSSRPFSTLDADRLLRLDGAAWQAILAAAAAPRSTLELAAAQSDLPDLLVAAAAPLPPRLRLAFRWQVGGAPVPAGTLRVVAGAGGGHDGRVPEAVPCGVPCAGVYRWLEARARARDVAALEALAGDWTIRSWEALASRIDALGNGDGARRQ